LCPSSAESCTTPHRRASRRPSPSSKPFGAREIYSRTEAHSENSSARGNNQNLKHNFVGVKITKRLKPKEAEFDPHAKRFIRKDKTFAPFSTSKMIKLDKIMFSFSKTSLNKKTSEDADSLCGTSQATSHKVIRVTTDEDIGLASSGLLRPQVRRPMTSTHKEKRAKNMHLVDQERIMSNPKLKDSGCRVRLGSSSNLHHLACLSKQPLNLKPQKAVLAEDVSSQFSLQVRPYSSNNLFNISRTEVSGGSRVATANPKKSRNPSPYNSANLITVEMGLQAEGSRVKTAELFAHNNKSKRELTAISKETSMGRPEGSNDRNVSEKPRPKSSFPVFVKQTVEKGKFDQLLMSKR
jgi:hypothetical protein